MAKRKTEIEKRRVRIDEIDGQIVELLDERAQMARLIGQEKNRQGLEFYDPGRQRRVIQKVLDRGGKVFSRTGLKAVYTEIMSTCLALERPIRVGFLGPEGTFAHQAAAAEFGQSAEYHPIGDIPSLFKVVEKDQVDYSVVPIENSTGGIVHKTLDMFLDFDVTIGSEIMLGINLHLLANCPMDKITKIYSHPQVFLQCQSWLARNLPKPQKIEVESTVQGVQHALKERRSAAICSRMAAKLYKIKPLVRNIEDSKENTTRFWVLGHQIAERSGNDRTSLMFSVKDRAGALVKILGSFAKRRISLTKIESRPTKRKAWEYVFFCDLKGHLSERRIQNALKEIEPQCIYTRILGSYPRECDVK